MSYQDGIVKQTEFFTTAELAHKLKMNVQVVTRKVQAGEIRAYKIGKEWRIPEQAVFEWLEQRTNQPHSTPASLAVSGPFHQSGEQPGELAAKLSEESRTEKPSAMNRLHDMSLRSSITVSEATGAVDGKNLRESTPLAAVCNNPILKPNALKPQSGTERVELPRASLRRPGSEIHASASNGTGGTRRFLLEYILAQFEPHRVYLEHEVDLIIRRHGQEADSVKIEMLASHMLSNTSGKFTRRLDYQLASTT